MPVITTVIRSTGKGRAGAARSEPAYLAATWPTIAWAPDSITTFSILITCLLACANRPEF